MNDTKIILDLCGGTGGWSKPYRNSGYDVRIITLPYFDVTLWRSYPEIVKPVTSGGVYRILAARHARCLPTLAQSPKNHAI